MTLVELVVVVALGAVVLLAAGSFAIPWLQRETMRSAVYDVQTHLQLARIEAVSRNRSCRFVIDTATRQVRVFDTVGTANTADDVMLYDATLSDDVDFSRPEGGAAVTLSQIGATTSYEAEFDSDGTVVLGVGDVVLLGGQRYGRIALFGAGGTQVERWINGAWHVGS